MSELETALTLWEKIDLLDVPTLALLTIGGFVWVRWGNAKNSQSNKVAFLNAMHSVEKQLAGDQVIMRTMAETLKSHVDGDRMDFQRVFDKIEESRQNTQDLIISLQKGD